MDKEILDELIHDRKKQILEMELLKEYQEEQIEDAENEKQKDMLEQSLDNLESQLPQLKDILSFLENYDAE